MKNGNLKIVLLESFRELQQFFTGLVAFVYKIKCLAVRKGHAAEGRKRTLTAPAVVDENSFALFHLIHDGCEVEQDPGPPGRKNAEGYGRFFSSAPNASEAAPAESYIV